MPLHCKASIMYHVSLFDLLSSISAKALGAGAASWGSVVHSVVEYAGVGAAMLTAPGAGVVWKPLKGV